MDHAAWYNMLIENIDFRKGFRNALISLYFKVKSKSL